MDAYSIAIGNRITTSSDGEQRRAAPSTRRPSSIRRSPLAGVTLDPTATQNGVTAFLNGISHADPGRGRHRQLSDRLRRLWPGRLDLGRQLQRDLDRRGCADAGGAHWPPIRAPPSSIPARCSISRTARRRKRSALTANWSLDEFGVTLRETFYGPDHSYTSPKVAPRLNTCVYDHAGVGGHHRPGSPV